MRHVFSGVVWIGIYLALVLAPLLVLLTGPVPPGAGFWWDLSMAIGFAGIAMLGVQFVLTARFRRASAPFGLDILYYFHRTMAIFAFILIGSHYLLIRLANPDVLGTANPLTAPWHMTSGRAALLCFAAVIVTAVWRKPLGIPYDAWRLAHVLLTLTGLHLAVGHIEGVNYYLNTPGKRPLWIAFTLSWVLLIVYVRAFKPWHMRKTPYHVVDVKQETGNTWTLAVQADGHAGLRFQPGQFAWLTLRASPFALKEHPFSFSSSAEQPQRLEFTIKDRGDFTRTVPTIAAGEVAYLDGPYGAFSVDRYTAPGLCVYRRRRGHRADHEHVAHLGRPARHASVVAHLRQQSPGRYNFSRSVGRFTKAPVAARGTRAGATDRGLERRVRLGHASAVGKDAAGEPPPA